MKTTEQTLAGKIDEVPTPEEFVILKRVAEAGIRMANILRQPERAERIKKMLDDMEVRVCRLYPTR